MTALDSSQHVQLGIKTAVQSASTCSDETVQCLRCLLNTSGNTIPQNNTSRQRAPRKTATLQLSKKKSPKTIDIYEDQGLTVSTKERLSFATDIVNAVLKTLSDVVKTQNTLSLTKDGHEPEAKLEQPKNEILPSRQTKAVKSKRTIQEISSNRVSTSPGATDSGRKTRTNSCATEPTLCQGPEAIVECARIAFEYLRAACPVDFSAQNPSEWHIEHGMVAFVGMLISLQFGNIAAKELKSLKRRLEARMGQPVRDNTVKNTVRGSAKPPSDASRRATLATLLHFETAELPDSIVPLIISYQILVLRTVGIGSRPQTIESLKGYIGLGCSQSPANLINRLGQLPGGTDRAARLLEQVSQVLLSFCPKLSLSNDSNANDASKYASPETCLWLQSLALRTRTDWMALSGHKGKFEIEILNQYQNCLAAFIRRCPKSTQNSYKIAKSSFEQLLTRLTETSNDKAKALSTMSHKTTGVYLQLAQLAEESSLYREAQLCLELLLAQGAKRTVSSAGECTLACRIAALNLNDSTQNKGPSDLESHRRALSHLVAHPIGTAEEMTNMTYAILSLRKAASNFIKANAGVSTSKIATESRAATETCRNIVSTCMLLQLELYKATQGDGYQCEVAEAQHRRQVISKTARASIEAIVYDCSQLTIIDEEIWIAEHKSLQLCVALVHAMKENEPKPDLSLPSHDATSPSLLTILSNAFFRLYVSTKDTLLDQSLSSLQESCDALSAASAKEKKDGNLLNKIVRLAQRLCSKGRHGAARSLYLACFKTWCEIRRLDENNQTFPRLHWKGDPQLQLVTEAIRFLIEAEARLPLGLPSGRLFLDDENLSTDDRGAVLEWQLRLVSDNMTSKSFSSYAIKLVPTLVTILYELYQEQTHHLQRTRVSLKVLDLAADMPDCIPANVLTLAEECVDREPQSSNDQGESSPYLKLCLAIALLLRGLPADENRFETAMSSCSQLVQSACSLSSFAGPLDDLDQFLQRLSSLSRFLGSKGRPYMQLSVARLVFKLQEQRLHDSAQGFVRAAIDFGLELLHLGYSELAGIYFSKAQDRITSSESCDEESLELHLAYAEYYLDLGDQSQSREHIDRAERTLDRLADLSSSDGLSTRHAKIFAVTRNADLSHLYSRLHFLTGSFIKAFWFAKKNVTFLQSVWKGLEGKSKAQSEETKHTSSDEPELVDAFTKLELSALGPTYPTVASPSPNGPKFWPFVPRLFRALIHLAELYQLSGLVNDATYNLDQALRLAEGTNASHALAMALIRKGNCAGLSGSMEASWGYLDRANKVFGDSAQVKDSAALQLSMGRFYHLQEQWKTEVDAYDLAESILNKLVRPGFTRQVEGKSDPEDNLQNHSSSTKPASVLSKRPPQTRAGRPRQNSKVKDSPKCNLAIQHQNSEQFFLFAKLKDDLMRLKAESFLAQGNLDASAQLVSRFNFGSAKTYSILDQRICQCRQLVSEAIKVLSADGVFAMVAESAISFPGAAIPAQRLHSETTTNCGSLITNQKQQKQSLHRANPRAKHNTQSSTVESFRQLLNQALQGLSMKRIATDQICNISVLRQAVATVGSASLMLSSVKPACSDLPLHPMLVGHSIDMPQCIASLRDQAVTYVEKIQKHAHQKLTLREDLVLTETLSLPGISDLNTECIDLLPMSWTVISVSLDESRNHLHLTRYRSNQCAFVVRLPLTRQNAEDPDEESFTFADAKAELSKIVALSDATVHAARESADGMKKKSAKTQWWAEREALDSRLHDFLLNIENMWLGGFRGIFSQYQRNPHLLARFRQSFEIILEKHLPSRQMSRKRPVEASIKLDPQVLDLFVGLANSLEGIDDMDETLTDLLYFVVDILQFNGEANAYDEVDFDSIIIETQGALRSYYEASKAEPSIDSPQHTILVLDKQLHSFPWESLPCLDGASVSRLYSLIELRERIAMMREQSASDQVRSGIFASSKRGTSILNPSGDLKKTQSRFEQALSSLSETPNEWTSFINRAPTEDDFAAALYKPHEPAIGNSTSDILLYFGHGSGAQYVRHRRIKQLRCQHHTPSPPTTTSSSCSPMEESLSSKRAFSLPNPNVSTSLLFGCSSASLRDNFEFEPHGTPKSYMLAGAPALLGSLWDVTDGDIDKFAGGVLERWGLFESGTFAELREEGAKAKSRGRAGNGKGKMIKSRRGPDDDYEAEDVQPNGQTMSLTEAVSKSRGDCYLRYLNGAAMVVYGVPVYLAN